MTDLEFREAQVEGLERALRDLKTTLRDDYAKAALTGLLVAGWAPADMVVEKAFEIADLALEARK